ncbi:MAG: hypothetical protein QM756_32760 [Polyangiaceae bacterium]
MTFAINCSHCGATAKIPTSLFVERFAGRKTTIRCKRCAEGVVVDDSSSSLLDEVESAPSTGGSLGAVELSSPEAPLREPAPAPRLYVPERVRPRSSAAQPLLGVLVVAIGATLGGLLAAAPQPSSPKPAAEPAQAPLSVVAVTAPVEPAPQAPLPVVAAVEAPVAAQYDERALGFAWRWGTQQVELCHRRSGRPAGTVRAELSFEPSGKVSAVRLSGDVVTGSAEERCIVSQLRALMIPRYVGESFRISREIKLR